MVPPSPFVKAPPKRDMPKKLERCVEKVKAQNKGKGKKVDPYAVCTESTGIKKKKGGGWTRERKR